MMFGYFAKATPCVFGDPFTEAEVFGMPQKSAARPTVSAMPATAPAPQEDTVQARVGSVVGKRGNKLLVKLAHSGRTIEVAPTDIERVM